MPHQFLSEKRVFFLSYVECNERPPNICPKKGVLSYFECNERPLVFVRKNVFLSCTTPNFQLQKGVFLSFITCKELSLISSSRKSVFIIYWV